MQAERVFGEEWFARHQRVLLWLLNAPVFCVLVRWVLCIHDYDCPRATTITQIGPNRFSWGDRVMEDGRLERTTDFRTHAKFAKRVYHAFVPLWWAFHAWDALVADRANPELSFGFSTLTVFPQANPATTADSGFARRTSSNSTWANLVSGAGTFSSYTGNLLVNYQSNPTTNHWDNLYRSFVLFDTSALTSGASISTAVLSLFVVNKQNGLGGTAGDSDIFTATPASNTVLANADYGQTGSVSQTGGALSYAGVTTSAYNAFTFNATGQGNVSKTGVSKFSWKNSNYDNANVAPTWSYALTSSPGTRTSTAWEINASSANQAGTSQDPKLVVTYTLAGAAAFSALDLAGN